MLMPFAAGAQSSDIVDTATAAGNFSILVSAVQAAGLVETLKGPGPFTVFAPTDEAFSKLPAGTVETLLQPESKAMLAEILTYHVVPGKVMSTDLKDGMEATTVEGKPVTIGTTDGVTVNDAKVTQPEHRGLEWRHPCDRFGPDAAEIIPARALTPDLEPGREGGHSVGGSPGAAAAPGRSGRCCECQSPNGKERFP